MSANQTERTVPVEIEAAIDWLNQCWFGLSSGRDDEWEDAVSSLRHAILKAWELREKNERLDRLWRFVWFERECVRNQAFDLWGEALDAIRTELDALGAPPPLLNDADALVATTDAQSDSPTPSTPSFDNPQ